MGVFHKTKQTSHLCAHLFCQEHETSMILDQTAGNFKAGKPASLCDIAGRKMAFSVDEHHNPES